MALTDTPPARTTFRSLAVPAGWTCTTPPVGGAGGFTCTTPLLAASSSATFTLELDVACDFPNGTLVSNTATVAGQTDDPNPANNTATATVTVSNPTPVITGLAATPSLLWPPNHKLVDVRVGYEATDQCGVPVCRLGVTSNEPVNGLGDGDTAPDWIVVDEHTVRLRAERAGFGRGRVYTVAVTCADSAGGQARATTTVLVPKSMKEHAPTKKVPVPKGKNRKK